MILKRRFLRSEPKPVRETSASMGAPMPEILRKISKKSSRYINKCFKIAIDIMDNKLGFALINGPISKKHFLAGKFSGVTEYLSNKTGGKNKEVMLIYNKNSI